MIYTLDLHFQRDGCTTTDRRRCEQKSRVDEISDHRLCIWWQGMSVSVSVAGKTEECRDKTADDSWKVLDVVSAVSRYLKDVDRITGSAWMYVFLAVMLLILNSY